MLKFINPANIVAQAELAAGSTVADFGCGGGYFSLPTAQMVGPDGTVYAVDIMPDRLAATLSAARHARLKNITALRVDLEKPLTKIPESSCDMVIVSNILHQIGSRDALLGNMYMVLKTGAKVLAVEWKKEYTPLGPSQASRIGRDELVKIFTDKGFRFSQDLEADGSHYALLFIK